VLSNITEESLRRSRELRTSLKEYKEFYFLSHQNDPKYLKKAYTSKEHKETDAYQSVMQSSFMKDVERFDKVAVKNIDMMKENTLGQEGVNYTVTSNNLTDPRLPNDKVLIKQLRQEINKMKLQDPE
jgi:hypothetical protein